MGDPVGGQLRVECAPYDDKSPADEGLDLLGGQHHSRHLVRQGGRKANCYMRPRHVHRTRRKIYVLVGKVGPFYAIFF